MNRFLPWYEIYTFGSVAIFFSGVSVGLIFVNSNAWLPALYSFWVVSSIVTFLGCVLIFFKWFSPPDYITQQRVQVWSDIYNSSYVLPTLTDLEVCLDSFCEHAIEVLRGYPGLDACERAITKGQLRKMLYGAKLLYTRRTTALRGWGWRVRDRGCSQRKKMAVVRYCSPFILTNTFMALWHMVDSEILQRQPDVAHKNVLWWQALEQIQIRVEKEVYQVRSLENA